MVFKLGLEFFDTTFSVRDFGIRRCDLASQNNAGFVHVSHKDALPPKAKFFHQQVHDHRRQFRRFRFEAHINDKR